MTTNCPSMARTIDMCILLKSSTYWHTIARLCCAEQAWALLSYCCEYVCTWFRCTALDEYSLASSHTYKSPKWRCLTTSMSSLRGFGISVFRLTCKRLHIRKGLAYDPANVHTKLTIPGLTRQSQMCNNISLVPHASHNCSISCLSRFHCNLPVTTAILEPSLHLALFYLPSPYVPRSQTYHVQIRHN